MFADVSNGIVVTNPGPFPFHLVIPVGVASLIVFLHARSLCKWKYVNMDHGNVNNLSLMIIPDTYHLESIGITIYPGPF